MDIILAQCMLAIVTSCGVLSVRKLSGAMIVGQIWLLLNVGSGAKGSIDF